ncbi:HAD family hydrolase [Acinetobacter sp. CFCC 10889]|uniref:HAD family hydrolase n=1 Tax=Acinetobacter sp. CFCC 10889 TaxID=1775557 RepID=UPI000DD03CA0|nr:HAD family hydrolase [Acinetobacter sp. CFCC 10889]
MKIQAVLFDLDNTLTHRDQSVIVYAKRFLQDFSNHLDGTELEKTVSIIRYIDNGGYPKKERLTHPSIAASVGQALIAALAWNRAPDLDELTQYWFQQFGMAAVAMQGAEDLLQYLKQENYKLAVISNGGHATRLKILEGLGFTTYFDDIISSELVGVSKPKPEIFLETCQRLRIQPQQALYIGDHPVNDYAGATGAGLQALLLNGFHDDVSHIPQRIDNLKQVLDYLH